MLSGTGGAYAQTVYDIYPIPQRQVAGKGLVSFSKSVTVVCDAAIDAATRRRAEQVLKDAQLECTFATEAPATGAVLYLGVNGEWRSSRPACHSPQPRSLCSLEDRKV